MPVPIAIPELTLPVPRRAVATVAPPPPPEYFEDMRNAFVRAGDEGTVLPIRMFYRRWGVVVAIERRPATARRPHATEPAMDDPDETVRARAVEEVGAIA